MGESQPLDDSLPLLLIGIVGMFLLALSVIAFFIVYQQRLFRQQDHIRDLERAYEQDLLKSAVSVQERERERIAAELHDGLGSLLSTIRLYVLQFTMTKSAGETEELIGETKSVVDTAIQQAREISHDLLPSTLHRFGAIYAVEAFCQRLRKLQDIDINFSYSETYRFSQVQDLALYRIVQELINNTLKHAAASRITIDLSTVDDRFRLTYQDDGRGYDPDELKSSATSGLGMKSIESRVRVLNGTMTLRSAPGEGFTFGLVMARPVDGAPSTE